MYGKHMPNRGVTSYQRGLALTLASTDIILVVSRTPEVKQKIYFGWHKSDINVVINAFRIQIFTDNRYIIYQDDSTINSEVTNSEYLFYDGLNSKNDENPVSPAL